MTLKYYAVIYYCCYIIIMKNDKISPS